MIKRNAQNSNNRKKLTYMLIMTVLVFGLYTNDTRTLKMQELAKLHPSPIVASVDNKIDASQLRPNRI